MRPVNSPFKFLDSYQQEDADIFFGRATETDALYNALSGVKHLLVYGPSGAGKTSLIECGLRNQFSDADWFAVSIRRGANMTASVFARINEALHEKIDLNPKTNLPQKPDFDFGEAIETLFAERYQPIYLLFDQFEELLILGDEAEKRDFFTRLNRLIRYKVPCRVMLVMREEFIGHLSEFEPLCPSIFQHRFRLEKMGRSNVQSVIQQILEAEKYQSDFRVEQPAALAKSILAKLPDTQHEIELAHVQVFLEELWDRASAENKSPKPTLHSGLVKENDNLERVLDSFLKKQLEQLERSHGEKVPLELLATMISERHTKLQLGTGDLENALAKNGVALQKPLPDLLRDLEQRRIIRTLKSGEQTQFEISHDVLALVVGQNLTEDMKLREKAREIYRVYEGRAGMFSREDLDYLRAFEGYLGYSEELGQRMLESEDALKAKFEEEKAEIERRRSRALLISLMAGVLVLGAVAASVFAIFQSRKAVNAIALADEKTRIAEFSDSLATVEKTNAQTATERAEEAQIDADEKTKIAQAAEKKAQDAIQQSGIDSENALVAMSEAEEATDIAESAKSEAQKFAYMACQSLILSSRENILQLQYKKATSTIRNTYRLSLALQGKSGKLIRDSIAYEFMELAFFYYHTGNEGDAFACFEDAAGFLGRTLHFDYKKDFNSALQELDEGRDSFLHTRYFPVMVELKGGKSINYLGEIVNDFLISKYETTVWQYNLFCTSNGLEISKRDTFLHTGTFYPQWGWIGNYPVVYVDWLDAIKYANWLSEKMNLSLAYNIVQSATFRKDVSFIEGSPGYRLPTWKEWIYAADGSSYSGQSINLNDVGWYRANSNNRPHPVGLKKPTKSGIYDMSGNLWEWCFDLKSENGSSDSRTLCGCSWDDSELGCMIGIGGAVGDLNRYEKGTAVGFRITQSAH